jgi:hypothetical protein
MPAPPPPSDGRAPAVSAPPARDRVLCFAAGTLIGTAQGETPVEALRPGDLVMTVHGGPLLQPLVWVGRMEVDVSRLRNRAAIAPILIRAGALGSDLPRRDLRVSPNHALFLGGRLVPAGLLVNGTSIIQEGWCRHVSYHHIELAEHGLVLAEGAVSETYLDAGNRYLFDNAAIAPIAVDFGAHRTLRRSSASPCAPLLAEGDPALAIIRRRLPDGLRTTG